MATLTGVLRFDQLAQTLDAVDCQTVVLQVVLAQTEAANQLLIVRTRDGRQMTAEQVRAVDWEKREDRLVLGKIMVDWRRIERTTLQ